MNFFKNLFAKKEEPEQKKVIKPVKSKQNKPAVESVKTIDANAIKKECTQIKNSKGELEAVNFLKNVIASNKLNFEDATALLKKAIPYMRKVKALRDTESMDYVNSILLKFVETTNVKEMSRIAEIKFDVNPKEGLNYLESIFTDVTQIKNKPEGYFDLALQLSRYYLNNKQPDKAFQAALGGGMLNDNSNKHSFLFNESKKYKSLAQVCYYGQNEPKYLDFLHYEIKSFILTTSRECLLYYNLESFFHHKKAFKQGDYYGISKKEFEEALIHSNIKGNKLSFLNELFTYAYEEFPIIMGVKKENLRKIDPEQEQELYLKLFREVNNGFLETPFIWSADISKWIDKLLLKYTTNN